MTSVEFSGFTLNHQAGLPYLCCLLTGKLLFLTCKAVCFIHVLRCSVMSNSFVTSWTVGSSVHRIFRTRLLEWVAVSSCRGYFRPRYQTHVSPFPAWQADSLLGKPLSFISVTKTFLSFTAVSHLNCRPLLESEVQVCSSYLNTPVFSGNEKCGVGVG